MKTNIIKALIFVICYFLACAALVGAFCWICEIHFDWSYVIKTFMVFGLIYIILSSIPASWGGGRYT